MTSTPSSVTEGSSWSEAFTPEETLEQLEKLKGIGLIEVVLPTTVLGEQWVLVIEGHITKFTQEQMACWLVGVSTVVRVLDRAGVKPA